MNVTSIDAEEPEAHSRAENVEAKLPCHSLNGHDSVTALSAGLCNRLYRIIADQNPNIGSRMLARSMFDSRPW